MLTAHMVLCLLVVRPGPGQENPKMFAGRVILESGL